ncbi:MAG: ABC transporter ATP-binding protein [Candidatus Bilamarchaeaceae archaeon]
MAKTCPVGYSESDADEKCQGRGCVMSLREVTKAYDMAGERFYALCGVDLNIYKGDFISVLGPSGSGKSTLLHIMGLLDRPTTGKVFISGIETTKMNDAEQARIRGQKIGFVFQTFNLIPSLTSVENVEISLMIQGMAPAERRKRAVDVMTQLGLQDKLNNMPNQLSGGQRQRVAIARALVTQPDIILADEPTGNLDSKNGAEVLGILSELHRQGKTVVIITHDQSITKITHKTIRIRDGAISEVSERDAGGGKDEGKEKGRNRKE